MVFTNLTTRGSVDITTVCVRAPPPKYLTPSRCATFGATRSVTAAYLTAAETMDPKRESVALMGSHRTSIPTKLDRMPRNAPVTGSVSKWCGMVP